MCSQVAIATSPRYCSIGKMNRYGINKNSSSVTSATYSIHHYGLFLLISDEHIKKIHNMCLYSGIFFSPLKSTVLFAEPENTVIPIQITGQLNKPNDLSIDIICRRKSKRPHAHLRALSRCWISYSLNAHQQNMNICQYIIAFDP